MTTIKIGENKHEKYKIGDVVQDHVGTFLICGTYNDNIHLLNLASLTVLGRTYRSIDDLIDKELNILKIDELKFEIN